MDNLKEYAKNKIDELTNEIGEKALEIGWDSGDGILETLGRLDDGTASEFERRRADSASFEDQIEILNLMFKREKLRRAYFPIENDPMDEKVSIKDLFGVEIVK